MLKECTADDALGQQADSIHDIRSSYESHPDFSKIVDKKKRALDEAAAPLGGRATGHITAEHNNLKRKSQVFTDIESLKRRKLQTTSPIH